MKIGLQTWGSEGDIRPFIALAEALVKARHEVTLVVSDNIGRDYSGVAAKYGFTLISVRNPERHAPEQVAKMWRALIDAGNPIKQARMVLEYGFDPIMEPIYTAAKELCANNDVVVGHFFVYPLRVAAEKARTTAITVNVVHNCIPSEEICPPGLPDLGKWFYPFGWKLVRKMVNNIFLPRVNALRIREGLSPNTDVITQTWAADRLNLIAVSPSICQAPVDWEKRHQVCGFLNAPLDERMEEFPPGLETFLSTGEPPVYITFGSMMFDDPQYMRETAAIWINAITMVGCRAVIQLPVADLSFLEVGERIFKVTRAPYQKVFPRCSLVVHHGGAGTTQSSLLAGRPSVVVAHMADQFFWGSELKRLGVGGKTLMRKGLTSRGLAGAIQKGLADTDMVDRAMAIGHKLETEDGVTVATKLIEEAITAKSR